MSRVSCRSLSLGTLRAAVRSWRRSEPPRPRKRALVRTQRAARTSSTARTVCRTRGHRFLAPDPFAVSSFEDYREKLLRAFVILDPAERAARIEHEATQLAFAQGLELVEDPALLAEIAGMTEWPVTLAGRIEPRFLDLPPEVLKTSMRENQKFFSLRDSATARITGYVLVANRPTADDGATIRAGNARVLTARLADAEFFWRNDLRTTLTGLAAKLVQDKTRGRFGTSGEGVDRLTALGRYIAPALGADLVLTERAARLAKADLVSYMVYEFPELQGTMGRYYAERSGEESAVAAAIEEHYWPVGPSGTTPSAPTSVALALADKLDLLMCFWTIDEKPTGSKDPYALRRAALGAIRILLSNSLRLKLLDVLKVHQPMIRDHVAARTSGASAAPADLRDTHEDLLAFLADRLKVHLRDEGIRHDVIDAIFRLGGQDDLVLLVARVRALQDFLATEDGEHLLTGYKRASNIVEDEEAKDGVEYSLDPDPRLAETDAERALFAALDAAEAALGPALAAEDFPAAMTALARLRTPIDAFFDTTTVNAEGAMLRRNRLCLLNRIRAVMNRVAVFSAVEGG